MMRTLLVFTSMKTNLDKIMLPVGGTRKLKVYQVALSKVQSSIFTFLLININNVSTHFSTVIFYFLDNLKPYGLSMVSCTLDMCGSSFPCSSGYFFLVPAKLIIKYIISVTIHLIKLNMLNCQCSVFI